MGNSEQQWVAMIQLNYPPGTRLVLDHMDDPYAPVESVLEPGRNSQFGLN